MSTEIEKEIETRTANPYSREGAPNNYYVFRAGIREGYLAARSEMLDKAADGFDKWFESEGLSGERSRIITLKTWSAAKLSAFRDVEFTNEQYLKLESENDKLTQALQKWSIENNRLREALAMTQVCSDRDSAHLLASRALRGEP